MCGTNKPDYFGWDRSGHLCHAGKHRLIYGQDIQNDCRLVTGIRELTYEDCFFDETWVKTKAVLLPLCKNGLFVRQRSDQRFRREAG